MCTARISEGRTTGFSGVTRFQQNGGTTRKRSSQQQQKMRLTAENAFTVFIDGEKRARRNGDTLKYLEFAALKLDALGIRYEYLNDISQDYSALSRNS
jgi:hypothetical protein